MAGKRKVHIALREAVHHGVPFDGFRQFGRQPLEQVAALQVSGALTHRK